MRAQRSFVREDRDKSGLDSRLVEIRRVTRVTKGGKRLTFRACVLVGDHRGRVGYGVAKGADVQQAVGKATSIARRSLMTVSLREETLPSGVVYKFKASRVLLKPAPRGSGVIAGGSIRLVLEMAGVPNVVAKMLGANNKINNVKATFGALQELAQRSQVRRLRAPVIV